MLPSEDDHGGEVKRGKGYLYSRGKALTHSYGKEWVTDWVLESIPTTMIFLP